MTRLTVAWLLLMLTLAASREGLPRGAGLHPAQQPFRSTAELVTVDVLVTEGGRFVTGLTIADFQLRDSGVPQEIRQLYVDELPIDVIMVLDTSGSVRGARLSALRAAALGIVGRLRPEDRAAVVAVSHRLRLAQDLTGDRDALRTAVEALDADGGTALRDAAFAGLALAAAERRRTLLLVFTDGVDTASLLDHERVLQLARRSDATVYSVGIRDAPDIRAIIKGESPRQRATDDRFVRALAEQTGGRLVHAEQNRDISPAFDRVLTEYRSRYVLGYTPAGVSARGWRPIQVRLARRQGTVLARRGYVAD